MSESSPSSANLISNGRFAYIHDTQQGPPEAIDVHHIIVQRSSKKVLLLCFWALLLLASPSFFLFQQGKSLAILVWSVLFVASIFLLLLRKLVKKGKEQSELEDFGSSKLKSVTIFPSFGVQLETHYRSGRSVRSFVPVSKILKPVLNECVTPATCYWTLSLILRGEEQLLMVFKETYPPVKMLEPVWKALCAAIDVE